jgi:hypothetical protein
MVTVLPTRPLWWMSCRLPKSSLISPDLVSRPVAEHPGHVVVDAHRFRLLDDQRAIKPAANLLETSLVWVIPEGTGVDRVELVNEALAWSDGVLGKVRHAVHRVWNSHAVPVDGGFFGKGIANRDAEPLALAEADLRAWNDAVV